MPIELLRGIVVDELCTVYAEPGEHIVDILDGEPGAQIAERVLRGRLSAIAEGVRTHEISSRLWPSGVSIMAISTCWNPSPVTMAILELIGHKVLTFNIRFFAVAVG